MPLSFRRALLAILASFPAFFVPHAYGDEQLEKLLKRCREHLMNIKTIEETATIKFVHSPATDTMPDGENSYVLATDGIRFRDEFHQARAMPDPNPDGIQVFNGRQLFAFTKALNSLAKKTAAEPPFPPPRALEHCYIWLSWGDSAEGWNGMRSDRVWTNVQARLRYAGKKEVEGKEYEAIEFNRKRYDGLDVKVTVLLDPDLNYFPARVSYRADGLASDTIVLKHKLVKSDNAETIFPLQVKSVGRIGERARPETTITVDERSLRINQEIKEEVFQLDPGGAVTIIDADAEK